MGISDFRTPQLINSSTQTERQNSWASVSYLRGYDIDNCEYFFDSTGEFQDQNIIDPFPRDMHGVRNPIVVQFEHRWPVSFALWIEDVIEKNKTYS